MTPALVLLSGLFLMRRRLAFEAGFAVFLVAVAWNNGSVIAHLIAALRVASPLAAEL
jgi:hypothetical protein